jgi:hypothetical protein
VLMMRVKRTVHSARMAIGQVVVDKSVRIIGGRHRRLVLDGARQLLRLLLLDSPEHVMIVERVLVRRRYWMHGLILLLVILVILLLLLLVLLLLLLLVLIHIISGISVATTAAHVRRRLLLLGIH